MPARPEQSQSERNSGNQSGNSAITPGTYRTGDILARFASDGTFNMRNEQSGAEVAGEYAVENDVLTLSNPVGNLRQGVNFPLRCAVEFAGEAFTLRAAGQDGLACGPLTNAAYEKVQ